MTTAPLAAATLQAFDRLSVRSAYRTMTVTIAKVCKQYAEDNHGTRYELALSPDGRAFLRGFKGPNLTIRKIA